MLLIIITKHPYAPMAWHPLRLARAACQSKKPVKVFFYQDAAILASRFFPQPSQAKQLQEAWQELYRDYALDLPVCVSAALGRGVADDAENLAEGFSMVGLGELSELIFEANRVVNL